MRRWLGAISIGTAALFCAFAPLFAQANGTFSAVLSVNEATITRYDIDQRIALLQALGAPADNLDRDAIDQLTDDLLKSQFADRLGIVVSDESVQAGIAEFAAQRNLSAETLLARNADFGVSAQAMSDLIRAGLVWRQIVQGRFRSQALPSDRELTEALNLAATVGRESLRLAEIVLPFSERRQQETFAFAAELSARLNSGQDFAAAAQELSRSKSATQGGALDWMPSDRLPPLISAQVLALAPGEVTGPIPFPQGVVLLKLIGQREENAEVRADVTVTYGETSIAGDVAALAVEAANLNTCADMRRFVASHGQPESIVGPIALPALGQDVALRIARLDTGEADVMPIESGAAILFLCERTPATDEDLRNQMRGLLFSKRIAALGDGLLAELRRNAVIHRQ